MRAVTVKAMLAFPFWAVGTCDASILLSLMIKRMVSSPTEITANYPLDITYNPFVDAIKSIQKKSSHIIIYLGQEIEMHPASQ